MGEVKFKALHIDDKGFQANSVVKLWTQNHTQKLFNIAHMHLNDTSDEIPIDVEYLTSYSYDLRQIPFNKDISGQPLKYKILVFNWKIRDVLYNNGKVVEPIAYEEHTIVLDNQLMTDEHSQLFGKVVKVPYALLTYPGNTFVGDMVNNDYT